VLDEAILSGNIIRIRRMTRRFPKDKLSLLLAYEESKSFVQYIKEEFGENGILSILGHLKNGDEVETAIPKVLSISFDELEERWYRDLRRKRTWFVYLATHLYEILFFLAALTAIFGFVKLMIKKKAYKDEDESCQ